jgi:hypothetical protein
MKQSTRDEKATIHLELNSKVLPKVVEELALFTNINFYPNDSFVLDYDFWIYYFGRVEERLHDIDKIVKTPGAVVKVDSNILNKGVCLLYDIIRHLEEIKNSV